MKLVSGGFVAALALALALAGCSRTTASSDPCEPVAARVCAVCGDATAACAGWTQLLADSTLRANMPAACTEMLASIDQMATFPASKQQFCTISPMPY